MHPRLDPLLEEGKTVLSHKTLYISRMRYEAQQNCIMTQQQLIDLYLEKPLGQLISKVEKTQSRLYYDKEAHKVVAFSARSLPPFIVKGLSDQGIEFSMEETQSSRTVSGGHNLLRSIADKMLAKGLNNFEPDGTTIDVGSKFTLMKKILQQKYSKVDNAEFKRNRVENKMHWETIQLQL